MNLYNNELYMNDVFRVANDKNLSFENLKNSKILITGATGLICSFLIDVLIYRNEKFNDNISIYMLCRNKERLINRFRNNTIEECSLSTNNGNLFYILQDVCMPINLNINFDYIIHGASNTHPKLYSTNPVGTITTNVIGLYNLLNYSVSHKVKRIFMMSSVEIYGENKGDTETFQEDYLGYINCNTLRAGYPESKRLCESLCQAYISQYNQDIVIGRLSRVYGPTLLKEDTKALSQFIRNAVNNEDIVLKSEGNQFYSYIYVVDAVSAIFKILFDGKKGEAYNIGDENSNIKLKDLAMILANLNDKKVVFELPDELEKRGYSTATKAILNTNKIKKLGWKPYYNIEEGLKNTISIIKSIN